MTSINGKTINNALTRANKNEIYSWSIPDYENVVEGTTADFGEWIQALKDSWVFWTGTDQYAENIVGFVSPDQGTTTYVVGYRVDDTNSNTEGIGFGFFVPAGWWFKVNFENQNTYRIYPLKGAE